MRPALDDIAFLASSDHRVGVLEALRDRPADRDDLRAATGASSPTMGRVLADFQDRHWIEREGRTYRLTALGEFVADRLAALVDSMAVERRLREVWPWLPHDAPGFSLDLVVDAEVSYPGSGYPYEPIERDRQLLETAERIRGFGMAMVKSSALEAYFDRILDGLECEFIYPPEVFEALLAWNAETIAEAVARDNYTVLLSEELPNSEWCGICLSDDRLSICCYEPDTGALRAIVDTDDPEACGWGESIYERYRARARPLEEADDLVSTGSTP